MQTTITDQACRDALAALGAETHTSALSRIRVLRAELDELEASLVARMRADGFSWELVAKALGVSRSAAWQRFGPRLGVGHVLTHGHDPAACPECS